jgi:hypothetical protein
MRLKIFLGMLSVTTYLGMGIYLYSLVQTPVLAELSFGETMQVFLLFLLGTALFILSVVIEKSQPSENRSFVFCSPAHRLKEQVKG